ncbi:MAG: DUF4177 domain-containing protein [Peptostreptococcaceae bacterium]
MKKIEYKVENLNRKFSFNDALKLDRLEKQLNDFGINGWEVVSINWIMNIVVLKREI